MEERKSLKQREQMLGYLAEFLKGFQVSQDKGKVFKPPGPCMNTNKEENRRMRERIALFAGGKGVTHELDTTATQDEDC